MKHINQANKFGAGLVLLAAAGAANAATDYSGITASITAEQTGIIGVIIGVAGVLAAVYAVKRGAGIALSAVKGR